MERYTKYKDSGIAWLGEIPEHWEIVPMTKYLESIIDYRGRTPNKIDSGLFLVTAKNIKNGIIDYSLSEEYVDRLDAQSLLNRGIPQIGDVLFTTEAPLGEVANIDKEDIALAQRVIKFRGKKNIVDNYFLKYWIMCDSFQQDLYTYATGSTALGIKASKLSKLLLLLSPIKEQKLIAAFLDRKTAEIDELIAQKQRLIALYEEEKTAIINEAVTKGINPDVKLKPTAIDWLGDIPEHWELIRQKFVFVMEGGSTPSKNNPEFWNGSIPWVSSKDMKKDRLNSSLDYITQKALDETSIRIHPEGKILIVVRGMILAHSFPVAVVLRCNGEESYD
jgi:type I restriction enzyme S subunit